MTSLTAAGEAVLLAHEGRIEIAAALSAGAHRLARRVLAQPGKPLPNAWSE